MNTGGIFGVLKGFQVNPSGNALALPTSDSDSRLAEIRGIESMF